MTVETTVSKSGPYAGAGTSGPFPVTFPFQYDSDLRVVKTLNNVDVDLVLGTDYIVSGDFEESGTVALFSPLPVGQMLTIVRNVPFTQLRDYVQNDPFPAQSHELALDKLTQMVQQIGEQQDRSLKLAISSLGSALLPPAQGSYLLGFTPDGSGFQAYPPNLAPGDASNVVYSPGPSLPATNVQDALRNVEDVLSRKVYTQDYPTYQDAINDGDIIEFPAGTLPISAQFTVPAGKELIIRGTFTPTVNAATPGTPMILITGSDVVINWKHKAGIDCLNASFSNWNGISARATGILQNVKMFGGRFRNVGIDNTASFVVDFSAVQMGGKIVGGDYKNCGVINNVAGGGYAIYSDYCTGLEISGNAIVRCGSSGINSSTGLNNKVFGNTLEKITLFSFKAGYGTGITVSNNSAPTVGEFSVAKNDLNLKAMRPGVDFCMPRTSGTPPQGTIKFVFDNGTYLTIQTAELMPAIPVIGEGVQPLDTGTEVFGNSFLFSGDNTMDMNGMARLHVHHNNIVFGGWFQEAGIFAGLVAGIWAGYDPQGALQSMNNRKVTVDHNKIYNTKGSAIEVFQTDDLTITDNECYSYNEIQNPTWGGIDAGRLGFDRNTRMNISDNTCVSLYGYGVLAGFARQMKVSGNKIRSQSGIRLDTPQDCRLTDNDVTSTGASSYCYLVQDPSGANPGSTLYADNNRGYAVGAGGHVFINTDANFFDMQIMDRNKWSAANTSTELFSDISSSSTFEVPVSGVFGNVNGQPIRYIGISPGATVEIGQYSADNGRRNAGCVFEGFARRGTAAGEYFKGGVFGSVGDLAPHFQSFAANGTGAFLALGDFTASPNTPLANNVTVYYTNNEAEAVSLVGISNVYSGF